MDVRLVIELGAVRFSHLPGNAQRFGCSVLAVERKHEKTSQFLKPIFQNLQILCPASLGCSAYNIHFWDSQIPRLESFQHIRGYRSPLLSFGLPPDGQKPWKFVIYNLP